MKKRVSISQVMSTDITAVHRGMKLSEVYRFLTDMPFHHLPVVEGRKPVGMISSSDLLRLVYGAETNERRIATMLDHEFSIEDAMSDNIRTLPDTATVRQAADALSDGEAHSVVVVDDRDELIGIVTTTDLVRYLRDL